MRGAENLNRRTTSQQHHTLLPVPQGYVATICEEDNLHVNLTFVLFILISKMRIKADWIILLLRFIWSNFNQHIYWRIKSFSCLIASFD